MGLLGSLRVGLDRRRWVSQPFQLFSRFGYYQLRLLGSVHSIFLPRLLTALIRLLALAFP